MGWVDVSAEDITSRWRPLTSAEDSTIATLIEDAQDELEDEIDAAGYLPIDWNDPKSERRYKRTVAGMVKRLLQNPEGFLSETIEGEYSYQRAAALASGALSVNPDELAKFAPNRRRRRGAFTIRLSS
ncbi:Gp19/Gp15/Gp42 family protein [Subtercola sp. YIM 133946]|uniref:Gp19/Gp15/Gp42 family protein n=1 Tax=Subtercola sp. YIM 133946 TaxID=3118909 RepID=UPI002F92E67E